MRAIALIVALIVAPQVAAQSLLPTTDASFAVRVKTLREVRQHELFRTTVRQQFDFSCGSAALATLLTYHYRRPTDEATAFRAMFEHGDRQRIEREGFSMLDMKRYLDSLGYDSDGFEATLDELREAGVPAIALVQENGYSHFVVVKGIDTTHVLLGDPALGTRVVTREHFLASWRLEVFFIIKSHSEHARFNEAAHWRFRQPAPLADSVAGESQATAVLMRPGRNEF